MSMVMFKNSIFLLFIVSFVSCGPSEGDLVINKNTMDKYEIVKIGKYRDVLQSTKVLKETLAEFLPGTPGASQINPMILIYSNESDSIANAKTYVLKLEVQEEFVYSMSYYSQGYYFISNDEFKEEYNRY